MRSDKSVNNYIDISESSNYEDYSNSDPTSSFRKSACVILLCNLLKCSLSTLGSRNCAWRMTTLRYTILRVYFNTSSTKINTKASFIYAIQSLSTIQMVCIFTVC
uniref:Uncharacterized protein n=1 Tax=Brassica campestris TaxID=3711 RepID=A0A3P5ZG79_BRACM|nr:unnamed protein product [Brassica rapa]